MVIDSHFDLIERRQAFNVAIEQKAGRKISITHADSSHDPILGLVDFVAGAVLYRCRRGDDRYERIFDNKVIEKEESEWRAPKKW